MRLFWVAAYERPTAKAAEEGAEGRIVMQPRCVLAADAEKARVKAARELPEDVALDRVEVVVSPFVE